MSFKFLDRTLSSVREASIKIRETTEQAIDVGKEKLRDLSLSLLGEINGLAPILTECGFIIGDINLTLPFPPEIKMSVEQTGEGEKTLEQILAEDNEKAEEEPRLTTLQKTILNSMVKANELAQLTDSYGYTFKRYDIALTTPPKVTIHLISKKSRIYD